MSEEIPPLTITLPVKLYEELAQDRERLNRVMEYLNDMIRPGVLDIPYWNRTNIDQAMGDDKL